MTTAMNNWRAVHNLPDIKQALLDTGNFSPDDAEYYAWLFGLDEEQYRAEISKSFRGKSRTQPAYWNDSQYNNLSQPVVGLTWFEANAYCAWLSAVTGRTYRLPTEVEWEAAARGILSPSRRVSEGDVRVRIYPWGNDWDPAKANSLEGRVLKPSPVGAYAAAGAKGPCETEDQSGNVWNWTSSLYLPYPNDPGKSEDPEADGKRILRGGSWYNFRGDARCAYRDWLIPDDFIGSVGFRLFSPGS
jgi:formylglycine-generating enzyme required for sulfatase activity